jgi:hypothetical protein
LTVSALTNEYDQAPATQVAAPFSLPAPERDTETSAVSPLSRPHVPPIDVTTVLETYGRVRAEPFTVAMVTTGAVLSTVMLCGLLVPVLPAESVCVAVTWYAPSAENAPTGVKLHVPSVQVAAPFCELAPVIDSETVAESPDAEPQVPPKEVTVALVRYGKVRAVPLTVVMLTAGAVLSMVMDFAPDVPVFFAASDWVAVTE